MRKLTILSVIIGIIVIGVALSYVSTIKIDKDPSKDPFKVGIVKWVTSEQFDENISEFKRYLELDEHFHENNLEYLEDISYADKSKHKEIVQRFIDEKVDLIFTQTTSGTLIAKEMTQDMPIVFSVVTYPVEAGIIDDLSHSGNNLVGTGNYISIEKQFDFFIEIAPIKKLGFVHKLNEPNSIIQYNEVKEYANNNGIEIIDIAGTSLEDLESLISENISKVDTLCQACDTLVQSGGEELAIKIATEQNKPTFSCNLDGVKKGALAGKVANFIDMGQLSGLSNRILEGSNIDFLKTESPSAHSILNLKTADSLGIEISPELKFSGAELVS